MESPSQSHLLTVIPGPNTSKKVHTNKSPLICPLKIINGQSCIYLAQTFDLFMVSSSGTTHYHFRKPLLVRNRDTLYGSAGL